MTKPANQRRFTRVPFKVGADLTIGTRRFSVDAIENLSVGGCLLPVDAQAAEGTPCRLEIHIGGGESNLDVRVEGEVLRCASVRR